MILELTGCDPGKARSKSATLELGKSVEEVEAPVFSDRQVRPMLGKHVLTNLVVNQRTRKQFGIRV